MSGFVLTPAAEADILAIGEYIAQDSVPAALKVVAALERAMSRIGERPGIGHSRKDLALEGLRLWIVYSYLIVYRPKTDPVQIVRIVHAARDFAAALGGSAVGAKGKRRGRPSR